MLIVSVDTSLSKFATIIWKDGVPVIHKLFRTGKDKTKKKLKSVKYFDNLAEQINWLSNEVISFIKLHGKPDKVYLEGLSFGSSGNASRDLASIYALFVDKLHEKVGMDFCDIEAIPPTTIKAVARTFLPLEEQTEINAKGKQVKRVMSKDLMITVAEELHPEILEGLVKSAASEHSGKEDMSDAILCYYAGQKRTTN